MRRTTIVAGSAIAALATAGVLAVSGGAQAPTGQTIQFVERGGSDKFVDVAPRSNRAPSAGDSFLFSVPLYNAENKRIGTLDAKCSFTKGGNRTARGVCEGVFTLPDGDLYGAAKLSNSNTTLGVITGGTGGYAGARGTFRSVDRPGEGGGDPSDTTITLLP
jgi:hypothetical protein